MDDVITTEYDGCGMCFVGVRRLSRKTDATNSPTRQLEQIIAVVEAVGGHIIAWADDWEVSGATDLDASRGRSVAAWRDGPVRPGLGSQSLTGSGATSGIPSTLRRC